MASQAGQILTNGLAPLEAESDGLRVRQQSIKDQILADQHAAAVAARSKTNCGVVFRKLLNPGAASDQQGTMGGGTNFDGAGFSL